MTHYHLGEEGGGGGEDSHIKVTYLLGLKSAVLVPLRIFSFTKFSDVAFVEPLNRIL